MPQRARLFCWRPLLAPHPQLPRAAQLPLMAYRAGGRKERTVGKYVCCWGSCRGNSHCRQNLPVAGIVHYTVVGPRLSACVHASLTVAAGGNQRRIVGVRSNTRTWLVVNCPLHVLFAITPPLLCCAPQHGLMRPVFGAAELLLILSLAGTVQSRCKPSPCSVYCMPLFTCACMCTRTHERCALGLVGQACSAH